MRHQFTRLVMLSHIGAGPALQKGLDNKTKTSFSVVSGLIDDSVQSIPGTSRTSDALTAARFLAWNQNFVLCLLLHTLDMAILNYPGKRLQTV